MTRTPGARGRRAVRVASAALALAAGVALLAGVALSVRWVPTNPWEDIRALGHRSPVRTLHTVALLTVAALGAVTALGAAVTATGGRRWAAGALGASCSAGALAVLALRPRLLWSQIGLRAVTVNSRRRGFWTATGPAVRFVLVGGRQVSTAAYRRILISDIVVLPALVLAAAGTIWLLRRPPSGDGERQDDAAGPVGPPLGR